MVEKKLDGHLFGVVPGSVLQHGSVASSFGVDDMRDVGPKP